MNNINFLFVTLFGIGKLKKIPGSYASLATTIFLFFLFHIIKFIAKSEMKKTIITLIKTIFGETLKM